jgi:hypothetical protein
MKQKRETFGHKITDTTIILFFGLLFIISASTQLISWVFELNERTQETRNIVLALYFVGIIFLLSLKANNKYKPYLVFSIIILLSFCGLLFSNGESASLTFAIVCASIYGYKMKIIKIGGLIILFVLYILSIFAYGKTVLNDASYFINYFFLYITGFIFLSRIGDIQPFEPRSNINYTDHEIDLINLLALEYTYKDIGKKLKISESTVKMHIYNLYYKMGVKSANGCIYKATKEGLI